ncbi:MAG TPA: OsmC family protein [Thermoanaerobaculia bacterium]|nr:OsmC family protein [Thermoanaerobaculia bacterium]
MRSHEYRARLVWDGNLGDGTASYAAYGRQYRVVIEGKPELSGSANPAFRGERGKHDPEDFFLAAISSCHMLSYLALCARDGIRVVAYEDEASGTLALDGKGGGRFEEVTLRPIVTIAGGDANRAANLHQRAHELCFIASSCSVPIRHEATIRVEERDFAS